MDGGLVLLILFVFALFILGPIIAIVALVKAKQAVDETWKLSRKLDSELRMLRGERAVGEARRGERPVETPVPPPQQVVQHDVLPLIEPEPPRPAPVAPPKPATPPPASAPAFTGTPIYPRIETKPTPPPATHVPPAMPHYPAQPPAPAAPKPAPGAPSKWLDEEGLISWAKVEAIIGKNWMTWAGVLALFVAVALFAKFAFDRRWIGPGMQILAAVAFGLALAGVGVHFLRKGMRAFGEGLAGGGIMILYVALFCAYSPKVYDHPPIDSPALVFALMCVVTAAGMAMSVAFDALVISFLAILGGFLTPVLVSTGANQRDILFAYLMLLDLGVLAVAFYKKWRALDVLAFTATCLLFGGWFYKFYAGHLDYASQAVTPTTVWLCAFFAVFLVLPFVRHLITRTPVTVERFVMALANATYTFAYAGYILYDGYKPSLAGIALVMSGAYLALGVVVKKRIPEDARSLFGFIALSVILLTISVPVYFLYDGITIGWTAEAIALVYLGYQFRYQPVRTGAFLVLLIAVGRVFHVHWPNAWHTGAFTLVFNREFLILMCAPVGLAVSAVIHRVFRAERSPVDSALQSIEAVAAPLLFLAFLHVELGQWLSLRAGGWGLDPQYLKDCSLAVMWALGAAAFIAVGWRRNTVALVAGVVPLAVAVVHACALFALSDSGYYLFLNGRFWACAIVSAVLYAWSLACANRDLRVSGLIVSAYASLLLVCVEIGRWVPTVSQAHGWVAAYMQLWPMALACAAWAGGFLAVGRMRKNDSVRAAGLLALFAAGVMAVACYSVDIRRDFLLAINWRFAAVLAFIGCASAYALTARSLTWVLRGIIGAGYTFLVLCSVEIGVWISQMVHSHPDWHWGRAYVSAWSVSLLWTAGAVAFLFAWRRWKAKDLLIAGIPAALIALLIAGVSYITDDRIAASDPATNFVWAIFLNWRFVAALVACMTLFEYSLSAPTRNAKVGGLVASGYAALALVQTEVACFWDQNFPPPATWVDRHYWTLVVSAALWSVGAAVYLVAGSRTRAKEALWGALAPLGVAAVCGLWLRSTDVPGGWTLFANARFWGCAAVIAAAFWTCAAVRRERAWLSQELRAAGSVVLWGVLLLFLALLSLEPYQWCHETITDAKRAGWLAQMSVSIVWAVYASAVLAAGFWKRARAIRFAALGLFALTAGKLAFVDLAGIEQLYRIVSFFILGLLMIASAYAYNKAEGLLKETEPPAAP